MDEPAYVARARAMEKLFRKEIGNSNELPELPPLNRGTTHMKPDFELRVAQYVQLRALIKAEDDEHKEKMKEKRDTLDELNNLLLQHLEQIKADNVRTKAGTVYRTAKRSASTADFKAFWDFVVEHKFWDLVDRKPNVTAVSEYLEENKMLPPGVNLNSTYVVGVRKA